MADRPPVLQLIRALAPRYGLDPRAVAAVARTEGGLRWGAVGDQGTSYGPFQLHEGGALPSGQGAAFANSRAGLDYALRKMSGSGARGKRGRQAIDAIVRGFERPANPDAEVSKAAGLYGSVPAGAAAPQQDGVATTPGMVSTPGIDRQSLGLALLAARRSHDPEARRSLLLQFAEQPAARLAAPQVSSPAAAGPPSPAAAGSPRPRDGALAEAFYDPLGSYDNGRFGGPIGGHTDHVHLSITDPQQMVQAISLAQALGLRVSENPYVDKVDPVHVKGSYHYRTAGKVNGRPVGEALDASGDPKAMARFYRLATRRFR